jgi:imidazolonepropionase-like amidohydrolase
MHATAADPSWHFRATLLPYGETARDWWVDALGIVRDQPIPGAQPLPGRFAVLGLVDAHTHLSMDYGLSGLPDGSDALMAANLARKAAQGVSFVRDSGLSPGAQPPERLASQAGLQVLACANMHAPAGRYHDGTYQPTEVARLLHTVQRELARGASWIKLIADFPGADRDFFDPLVNYPIALVEAVCAMAHAQGARVAAHSTGPIVRELIDAGVDLIEHGTQLDAAALVRMARRGTAWVPAVTTITRGGLAHTQRAGGDAYLALLRHAERLGVLVLVGTGEYPDSYVDELALLIRHGMSPCTALAAASCDARTYFGQPGLYAGARCDVLLFEDDPRTNIQRLRTPIAILRGQTQILAISA